MSLQPEASDSERSSSSSPVPARQNRWTGASSTWLSLTSDERGLASSLDQLRSQDLSIHLYNAYALRKRAQRFWERKDNGEIFDEEGEGMGWAPSRHWTAWPMGAGDVPREGEIVGVDDGSQAKTLRGRVVHGERPSKMLEEMLVSITGRFARKMFEGRNWASSRVSPNPDDERDSESGEERGSHVGSDDELGGTPPSRQPGVVEVDEDGEVAVTSSKIRSAPLEPEPFLRPVVSADDIRTATLLGPSIRHTLTKLDSLLAALHHTRETCHQQKSLPAANIDDEGFMTEPEDSAKRPRGRPRKIAHLALLPRQGKIPSLTEALSAPELFRTKTKTRGRPQKVYPILGGESQQDYLIRIARLQKKPIPKFATAVPMPSPRASSLNSARSPSVASSRSRKSPSKRATSEERTLARGKKLGLRDWSEVLGTAALVGFPPEVLARAAKRCASLFAESFEMVTLPEVPLSIEPIATKMYQPKMIPDFGSDFLSSDSSSSVQLPRKSNIHRKRKARDTAQSWFCPLDFCRRATWGFDNVSKLRRHMALLHSMEQNEIDEALDHSGEIEGAVHVDGFLRPVRAAWGQRGGDKRIRKEKEVVRGDIDSEGTSGWDSDADDVEDLDEDDEDPDEGGRLGKDSAMESEDEASDSGSP